MRRSELLRRPRCVSAGSVAGLVALGVALLPACGPTRYMREVSGEAHRAVVEARAADAEELAPYEYWTAVEYLEMAKEKAAYADFEQSLKYGSRAKRMARRAKRTAYEVREVQEASKNAPKDSSVRAEIPSVQ